MENPQDIDNSVVLDEKQMLGETRLFKGAGESGWFRERPFEGRPDQHRVPISIREFPILEVEDNAGHSYHNSTLPDGSFMIFFDFGSGSNQGAGFQFSHKEDIEELLEKMHAKSSQELKGKKMLVYWREHPNEGGYPLTGSRLLGIDLPVLSR